MSAKVPARQAESLLDSPRHVLFASRHGIISGADPLVRAGRPRPALFPKHQVSATGEEPAGGPAADQGIGVKICRPDRKILETRFLPSTTYGGVRRLILTPMRTRGSALQLMRVCHGHKSMRH